MQENDNLVQLQDENGKDVNFEHLMTIEHEGNYYVVLEATEDTDDCKEGEAIILKIVRDEESDEDVYATIEDEAEFNAVFDKCMAAMEEEDEAAALEMEVHMENHAARKCYQKAGFVMEGVKRHAFFTDGRFCDVGILSILRDEYEVRA